MVTRSHQLSFFHTSLLRSRGRRVPARASSTLGGVFHNLAHFGTKRPVSSLAAALPSLQDINQHSMSGFLNSIGYVTFSRRFNGY